MSAHKDTHTRASSLKVIPMPYIQGEARIYAEMSQPFAAHSHDHHVIGAIRKGARSMICNAKKHSISEGDLIVFNPGDVHECRSCQSCIPHETMIFDSITFSKSFAGNIRLDGPVIRNAEVLNRLDRVFMLLAGESGRDHDESSYDDRGETIVDAVVEMIDALQTQVPMNQEMPHIGDKKISDAKSYIEERFAEPISIEALAEKMSISTYALIRAYKKQYSITPLQDLISHRANHACKLLSLGMSPCEVAEKTGFCDQAHLTRVFKKRIGTTPAAYAREVADSGAAR